VKKINFEYNSFIHGSFIDEKICDEINHYYNLNKKNARQVDYHGVIKKDIRNSKDIILNRDTEFLPNFKNYSKELQRILDEYADKYKPHIKELNRFLLAPTIRLQRYPINGGFKKWHCENDGANSVIRRNLVFMTYLNDVKIGGTEFFYQNLKVEAKKGLTIIWPAYFTHIHRGIPNTTGVKTIITGWFEYI
jgi:prolyl 4-hydroxylase